MLVSALRSSRGASFLLLNLLGDARWQPVISVALVLEYEEVAKRLAKEIQLPEWAIEAVIDMICRRGAPQAIPFRLRPMLRDPDDDFLLELAVASQAHFIVTYNVSDFRGIEMYGVKAVTPAQFLRTIGELR